MKNITFAILCFLCLGGNAQTIENTLLQDSVVAYDFTTTSDSTKSLFNETTYDSVGNKTIIGYEIGNNGYIPNFKTVIKYDSKHREVVSESYYLPSGATVWIGISRKDFQFNYLDKVEKEINYQWDNAEQLWVAIQQTEYKIDANGFVNEIIGYEWRSLYQKLVATTKREFTKDSKGIVSTIKTSHLDVSTWINDSLIQYYFSKQGKDSAIINNAWNSLKQMYEPITALFYTYDINGKKTIETTKIWETTQSNWMAIGKAERFLDSFGNDTSIVYSYLSNNIWVNSKKTIKSFDNNGNQVIDGSYDWNYNDSIWIGSFKTETIFDNHKNQTSYTQFYWDYNNSRWYPSYRYSNTYNNKNKKISDFIAYWDYTDSVLVPRVRLDYYYDKNDSLIAKEVWAIQTGETQYSLSNKEFYYFSNHMIQIPQQTAFSNESALTVSLYPNPAHNYLHIKTNSNNGLIQILSSNGVIVKSMYFETNNIAIAIDDLNVGVWFVTIISKTEKLVKQFVK